MTFVTERIMRAGSFQLDLKPGTPESVRSIVRAALGQDPDGTSSPTHGHIVVTVARLPIDSVTAPGGIYTGRLLKQEGLNRFSGVGLSGWMGVNGQTSPRIKTRTAAARDAENIVNISLANGLTAGTITPSGGPTVQESEFGMVTYVERLSAMARQLGHEWHVNAAGQLNVADVGDLYPTVPSVMFTNLASQLSSSAGGIRLVDADAVSPKIDATQRASNTRAILALNPPESVETSQTTVAYDLDGNAAVLDRHIDHLDGTSTTGSALAAKVQSRWSDPTADFSISVNGDRWRSFVNPGELCYAYFPNSGIRDISNIVHIGDTTFPRLLRIQQVDWAPSEGDGVYFVPAPGQGATVDLSDWFVPGLGGSVAFGVGNGEADILESVSVARWPESEALQIGGNVETTVVLLSDGSAGLPSLSFASDIDTGIFRKAGNTLAISTGGVERVSISDTETDMSGSAAVIGPAATAATHLAQVSAIASATGKLEIGGQRGLNSTGDRNVSGLLATGWTMDATYPIISRDGNTVTVEISNADYSTGGTDVVFTLPTGFRPARSTPFVGTKGTGVSDAPSMVQGVVGADGTVSLSIASDDVTAVFALKCAEAAPATLPGAGA
jgi:hypothetical protein